MANFFLSSKETEKVGEHVSEDFEHCLNLFLKMWIVNKRNGEGVLSCKNDARARREIRIKPPNGDQSRRGSNCIWPQKEAIL